MTADEWIEALSLSPHPEGGYFRETIRQPAPDGGRSPGTAIYFLLKAGEASRWHRVDAAEVWHYYGGAPLRLRIAGPRGVEDVRLGLDIAGGERPQGYVPPGAWQSAESLGDFTLVGCTVSPGFEFAGFEMAPEGWDPTASPSKE